MGILDRFKSNKTAQDKARKMSDVAEQKANERTGNKYESQIDSGQQKLHEQLGMDEERPDKP